MRWEKLFTDLEVQLEAAAGDELDAEVADRTRREFAATSLEGRLRAASGRHVEIAVWGGARIVGQARRVGPGWLLIDVREGLPAVVAMRHLAAVRDLPLSSREEPSTDGITPDVGLAHVLRVLARDRTPTSVVLVDGSTYTGTIDRVGADYLDLAEHALDESRRSASVRAVRSLPLASVAVLRPRLE